MSEQKNSEGLKEGGYYTKCRNSTRCKNSVCDPDSCQSFVDCSQPTATSGDAGEDSLHALEDDMSTEMLARVSEGEDKHRIKVQEELLESGQNIIIELQAQLTEANSQLAEARDDLAVADIQHELELDSQLAVCREAFLAITVETTKDKIDHTDACEIIDECFGLAEQALGQLEADK